MEMLNSASMLLSFDLWAWILNGFSKWIINYGWMIIVFTIILKLVMTPLDVYQRIFSKKQAKVNEVLQPEMKKLQEKYANDKNKLNIEQQKLYKKYNVGLGGTCLSMLLTMGVSMLVFFTLFSSLRKVGNEKLYDSYQMLDTVCVQTIGADQKISNITDEDELNTLRVEIKKEYKQVQNKYSWLWVKNVWKPDSNTSQFVSFEDYAKHKKFNETEKEIAKERYNFITETIDGKEQSNNGYYILMILAVVISFGSQFLSIKVLSPKGQKLNTMNWVMMAIIPLSMIFFAWKSNVVFTIYIILNSLMSVLISMAITLILNKIDKNKPGENILLKNKNVEVVEYSRNYKK